MTVFAQMHISLTEVSVIPVCLYHGICWMIVVHANLCEPHEWKCCDVVRHSPGMWLESQCTHPSPLPLHPSLSFPPFNMLAWTQTVMVGRKLATTYLNWDSAFSSEFYVLVGGGQASNHAWYYKLRVFTYHLSGYGSRNIMQAIWGRWLNFWFS